MFPGIADRIREAREELGLTVQQLADRAEVDKSTIDKLGGRREATLGRLTRCAMALQVRPEWLIFGSLPKREPAPLKPAYPNQAHARRLALAAGVPSDRLEAVDVWSYEGLAAKSVWFWLEAYLRHAGEPDTTPSGSHRAAVPVREGTGPAAGSAAPRGTGTR